LSASLFPQNKETNQWGEGSIQKGKKAQTHKQQENI
jgi:hypothetical protein